MQASIVSRDPRSPRRGPLSASALDAGSAYARLQRGAPAGRSWPTPDRKFVLITGTSSGVGALAAQALAAAGHTVYAGMRQVKGRNVSAAKALTGYASENGPSIHPVDLGVTDQQTIDAAVQVLTAEGRLDVLVHNAGHMLLGPGEAFSPEELAGQYDVNVLDTQRVNRTVLPHLRAKAQVTWSGSARPACATAARRSPGPISRPKPRWTPSRSPTQANWSVSESTPSSSCPAPTPPGPTISQMRADRPMPPPRRSTTTVTAFT